MRASRSRTFRRLRPRRRPRTRREALARRADDLVGHMSWDMTRRVGRGVRSQIPSRTKRLTAAAGAGAGAATAVAVVHRRRRRPTQA
jgi:hypothetical protein